MEEITKDFLTWLGEDPDLNFKDLTNALYFIHCEELLSKDLDIISPVEAVFIWKIVNKILQNRLPRKFII